MPWSTVKASGKKLLPTRSRGRKNECKKDEAEMSTLIKDENPCSTTSIDVRKQVHDAEYFNAHASDGPPEQDLRRKRAVTARRSQAYKSVADASAWVTDAVANVPKSCRR